MTRKERRKMMRERKKERLKLTDKRHPKEAVVATLLGFASIVILAITCLQSGKVKGEAGIGVGVAGIAAFVVSGIGFIMAAKSLKLDGIRYLFPTIASIVNGLLVIFYVVLYFMGLYA